MGLLRLLRIGAGSRSTGDADELGLLFSEMALALKGMGTEEIKRITGYIGLLGKVAYADMDISEEETGNIRRVLKEVLGLEESQIGAVVDVIVAHRVRLFSVEDHLYSRLINEVATREQKLKLLEALFALAAADEAISQHEDAALWTVAKSLRLSHGDFIACRKKFQDYLTVLRKTAEE